ncbi:MAG: cation:proton antiporter [Burkholderiaceae bacterium]|nr:cation:proton antiporter [Burkholderiaceae bacterium]
MSPALEWADRLKDLPGPQTLQWAVLLALAALAGHGVQRFAGLPKIVGYAVVGALAGWLGVAGAAWPLSGMGLLLLELGIAVVLFEAGARLPLRWLRHNPMVLVQSLAESLLTFAVAWLSLRALGLEVAVVRALSVIAVAASPAVLMRVMHDLRASGPVTDRALALATLNTLYALTLGVAALHAIDRGDATLLAWVASALAVLGLSLLCGAALAALLAAALRVLDPGSQDTAVVVLALLAVCAGVTALLGGSAPLAALLGGLLLKQAYRRPWVRPRQLGTAALMLNIIMFVLVACTAAQADWSAAALAALVLTLARLAAKVLSLMGAGLGSGMAPIKSFWVGVTLTPMSSVALLLTSQFVAASHSIGTQVTAIALPTILVSELLGAALTTLALYRTGEAGQPWRELRTRAAGGDEASQYGDS